MSEQEQAGGYLWDRSGPKDADVVWLEGLLGEHRYREPVKRPWGRIVALAAALLLAAVGFWWLSRPKAEEPGLDYAWIEGRSGAGKLAVGAWLKTGKDERARITVADIGHVNIESESNVRLVGTGNEEHHLDLQRGAIYVKVRAPPRRFIVDTPVATAIDLGCEYALEVEADGAGMLEVKSGSVQLDGKDGISSFVPSGAICRMRPGVGPGVPYFADGPAALHDVLPTSDAALGAAFAATTKRDTLTLFHLLPRLDGDARELVVVKIEEIVPLPEGADRSAVLTLDASALEAWEAILRAHW